MRRVKRKVRHVLEKQITIGSLLRALGIALLVILCLGIIFGIPYQLGKASVDCSIEGSSKEEVKTSIKSQSQKEETRSEPAAQPADEEEKVQEEQSQSSSSQSTKSADYDDVDFTYKSVNFDKRGDDWGTVREITFTIDNQASAAIDITQLRVRIYGDGSSIPEWEDFEVNSAPIEAGIETTKTFSVHYSVTDIAQDKNLVVELRDEEGDLMGEVTEQISLE